MSILKRVIPILLIILCCISPVAAAELIPGGQVIGLRLEDGSVYIAGFDPELGSCAQQAGLKSGDRILTANGKSVACPEDLRKALETSNGTVELSVLRSGKTKKIRLSPAVTADGPRLGVYLRQGISGLGTVTYYEPDGSFGALGHGVMDGTSPIRFEKGTVCGVQLLSVRRGKAGQPGQLLGALQEDLSFGSADKNTAQGIFGKVSPPTEVPLSTGDAHVGEAVIRTTVDGEGPREYSVQILKLYAGGDRCRNLLLKVTDPELLAKTGGIVQGMGVSYNKDNLQKPVACKGFWCQSLFSLTSRIVCIKRRCTWTESPEVCDRDGWAKSLKGVCLLNESNNKFNNLSESCHTGLAPDGICHTVRCFCIQNGGNYENRNSSPPTWHRPNGYSIFAEPILRRSSLRRNLRGEDQREMGPYSH